VEVGVFKLPTRVIYVELQRFWKKQEVLLRKFRKVPYGWTSCEMESYVCESGFFWGRRGPSVHLVLCTQDDTDIQWFYNDNTVPRNEDVIDHILMANGFGEAILECK